MAAVWVILVCLLAIALIAGLFVLQRPRDVRRAVRRRRGADPDG